jgi:endonuclease/exonuclease/phosphatase family metal-dependent hydrolase
MRIGSLDATLLLLCITVTTVVGTDLRADDLVQDPVPPAGTQREAQDLVFCSYNIYLGGNVKRGGDRLKLIKEVIGAIKPDVLALQECHGWDAGDQASLHAIEAQTGLRSVLFIGRSGGHVALFFPKNWHIKKIHRDIPVLENGGGFVEFELPDRSELCIGAFHLFAWSEDKRLAEAQEISKVRNVTRRTIVMGDFNGLPAIDACYLNDPVSRTRAIARR